MTLFGILAALFVIDGVLTHLVVTRGGREVGPITRKLIGSRPDWRRLTAYTIVKLAAFGYLFMFTEGANLFHQGLVIGAALVVAWNGFQLYRALR